MTDRLQQLSDAGVSIWLDDLSRERIETGNLADLVAERHVVGVTTNPTIFAGAIAHGEQITFDYTTTELDMAERFLCLCGTSGCDGLVRGYAHLSPAAQRARAGRIPPPSVAGRRCHRGDRDPARRVPPGLVPCPRGSQHRGRQP
jgi:hypothetical protein